MTIDEAIQHCQEKACGNSECSKEHQQLGEWLKELKEYRESYKQIYTIKGRNTIENLNMDELSKKGIHWGDKVKVTISKV